MKSSRLWNIPIFQKSKPRNTVKFRIEDQPEPIISSFLFLLSGRQAAEVCAGEKHKSLSLDPDRKLWEPGVKLTS